MRLRRVSSADPCQRWKSLPESFAQEPQQMVAVGFFEAAWVAIGCSAYFGGLYRQHRARGKNANIAITSIARRMCQISFTLLKERRDFIEAFPGRSAVRLTAAA